MILDVVSDSLLCRTALHGLLWWQRERSILTRMIVTVSTSSSNPLSMGSLSRYVVQYLEGPFPPSLTKYLAARPALSPSHRIVQTIQTAVARRRGNPHITAPQNDQTLRIQQRALTALKRITTLLESHPTAPFCDEYLRFLHSSTFHEAASLDETVDPFLIDWELVIKMTARDAMEQVARAVGAAADGTERSLMPPVDPRLRRCLRG